jgi:D-alanyl-D-alanine dipeptidase
MGLAQNTNLKINCSQQLATIFNAARCWHSASRYGLALFLGILTMMPTLTVAASLVRLTDPDIIQSHRYAHAENFLGRPVPGYEKMQSFYCTEKAARALRAVNQSVMQKGYRLVVYDAYRPQRAVNAFIAWSQDDKDHIKKSHYYPSIPKQQLFSLGYLAEKSSHSRGSTFDITLIPIHQTLKPITLHQRRLANGEHILFLDDNTVDMGSSFDLFHAVSHHDSPLITQAQAKMRSILRQAMHEYGFAELHEEWWHYTLVDEPYPNDYFDEVFR